VQIVNREALDVRHGANVFDRCGRNHASIGERYGKGDFDVEERLDGEHHAVEGSGIRGQTLSSP
jgi:hypothetical protein